MGEVGVVIDMTSSFEKRKSAFQFIISRFNLGREIYGERERKRREREVDTTKKANAFLLSSFFYLKNPNLTLCLWLSMFSERLLSIVRRSGAAAASLAVEAAAAAAAAGAAELPLEGVWRRGRGRTRAPSSSGMEKNNVTVA